MNLLLDNIERLCHDSHAMKTPIVILIISSVGIVDSQEFILGVFMAPHRAFLFLGGIIMGRNKGTWEFGSTSDLIKYVQRDQDIQDNKKLKAESLNFSLVEKQRDRSIRKKLNDSIRRGINKSLEKGKGRIPWSKIVGYTVHDLMDRLESKFQQGMAWDNHSRFGWYIDQIIPIGVFNYTSINDRSFKTCWSLKNLRPLWHDLDFSKENEFDIDMVCWIPAYREIMECEYSDCDGCCFVDFR